MRRVNLPRPAAAGALVLAAWIGCHPVPAPRPGPSGPPPPGHPVVLIPGVTGTALAERATGELVWGDGRSLLLPRDGGYAVARPLPSADREPAPRLEPAFVIERIRLAGVLGKAVYGPISDLLTGAGHRRGSLAAPRPEETLFPFPYDWRQPVPVSAGRLLERLETLGRVRGEVPLTVDLVCQSNGAQVCRWLAKYGGATLEEAEAGRGGLPETVRIERLVLVGTSNGGSLRILREMHRGRRYLGNLGRPWRPEVLFTFPSLYQDLPAYRPRPFVDEAGRSLDVELYDPETWVRHGLSVFADEVRRRLARRERPAIFADEATRRRFLGHWLERARRFHRLLRADAPGFGPVRYYSIQNPYEPTPDRAVLIPGERGESRLLFAGDRELARKPYLLSLVTAPGDGHATTASQRWLSPQERAALAAPTFHVRGGHFDLFLTPAAKRRLLELLADGSAAQPSSAGVADG